LVLVLVRSIFKPPVVEIVAGSSAVSYASAKESRPSVVPLVYALHNLRKILLAGPAYRSKVF
jgi:hypothetical protein